MNMFYGRIDELGAATTAAKLYMVAYAPGQFVDLIDTFLLLGIQRCAYLCRTLHCQAT